MSLALYDTRTRRKRDFEPANAAQVSMYLCGPTVYSYAHIGNFRPAVVYDMLYRLLRDEYGADNVVYARNITDIDDKINKSAAEQNVDISVITDKFTAIYHEDSASLNILPPNIEPTATGHMDEMISLISRLLEAGHAYQAEGHVLFDVSSFEGYGKLSGRNLDDMLAGARVKVAAYKKDPADFVMWKPSAKNEPSWDSPFGAGRPGWHTECSAMIEANLGTTIDIHAGGQDLIFPHHENEIAQSMCAHDNVPLARFWLHNGFLDMDSEKMSKSLGNVKLVRDLLKDWQGEVLRYALLTAQYRAPLDWTGDLLARSRTTMGRYYGTLRRLKHVEAVPTKAPAGFIAALHDDLNTPQALAKLATLFKQANQAKSDEEQALLKGQILAAGALIGLFAQDPETWFKQDTGEGQTASDEVDIDALVAARFAARKNKDWAEADRLRDQLNQLNIIVEDGPDGSIWRRG
ncbi:Cysteinyl-tRNA synthetase [hydrothermal vent metagenome]|uniref:Cysteine--tRNA ligase n=1 Tax=hydrothermal vent metagenome TaxID=652676 RepID=A0A3B0RX18_9ZZZZ